MSICSISEKFDVLAPVDKVFLVFTDTDQLVRSFPTQFHFKILQRTSRHITQGSVVEYKFRVLGLLPLQFASKVHSFSPKRHITCVWKRRSRLPTGMDFYLESNFYFESLHINHTRITEFFIYNVPFGPFQNLVDTYLIKPFLKNLIQHRKEILLANFKK